MTTNSNNHYSKHYDERQLINRYRISFETMWVTFFLIFISGFIKISHGEWAAANTEMIILLCLPAMYFVFRSILKEAYFSARKTSYTWSVVFMGIVGAVNLGTFIVQLMKGGAIIANGALSETLFPLFLALPFLTIPLAYLIKTKMTKNESEDEE